MTKPVAEHPLKPHYFREDTMSDWTEWFSKNKQILLWVILGLFAILIIAFRMISNQQLNAENDVLQAQISYAKVEKTDPAANPSEWNAELTKLEAILNKHPELQSKYDAILAQTLIIDQKSDLAVPYAERTFARVAHDAVNYYEDFAKTSLVIGLGQYEAALTQAQTLQSQLDQATDKENFGTLYLYNLIRLAILHQQLNQPAEEKNAWDALQNYQGNPEAVLAVQELFRTDHASLSHYTNERQKAL